jgi:hypothetical protein
MSEPKEQLIARNAREAREERARRRAQEKRKTQIKTKSQTKTQITDVMIVDPIKEEDNMVTDENHQAPDILYWCIVHLDSIFRQVDAGTLEIKEILKPLSDLGFKIFDEALVWTFFNECSLQGIRGFIKSARKLNLSFSLESLSQRVICDEAFFNHGPSKIFWDKRVCLYKAFPCYESLKNHLEKLGIIPTQSGSHVTKCISKNSKDFLVHIKFGGFFMETSFYKYVSRFEM